MEMILGAQGLLSLKMSPHSVCKSPTELENEARFFSTIKNKTLPGRGLAWIQILMFCVVFSSKFWLGLGLYPQHCRCVHLSAALAPFHPGIIYYYFYLSRYFPAGEAGDTHVIHKHGITQRAGCKVTDLL